MDKRKPKSVKPEGVPTIGEIDETQVEKEREILPIPRYIPI